MIKIIQTSETMIRIYQFHIIGILNINNKPLVYFNLNVKNDSWFQLLPMEFNYRLIAMLIEYISRIWFCIFRPGHSKLDPALEYIVFFIVDSVRGYIAVKYSEWCRAGIIERFEKFKMATKMAANMGLILKKIYIYVEVLCI